MSSSDALARDPTIEPCLSPQAIRAPAARCAGWSRARAPTPSSTSGVTLDGQHLDTDARWRGPRIIQTVEPSNGRYAVVVRHYSAALVSVRVGADTLTGSG